MIILLSVLGTLAAQILIYVLLPKMTVYYLVIGGIGFLISKSVVITLIIMIPAVIIATTLNRRRLRRKAIRDLHEVASATQPTL